VTEIFAYKSPSLACADPPEWLTETPSTVPSKFDFISAIKLFDNKSSVVGDFPLDEALAPPPPRIPCKAAISSFVSSPLSCMLTVMLPAPKVDKLPETAAVIASPQKGAEPAEKDH